MTSVRLQTFFVDVYMDLSLKKFENMEKNTSMVAYKAVTTAANLIELDEMLDGGAVILPPPCQKVTFI